MKKKTLRLKIFGPLQLSAVVGTLLFSSGCSTRGDGSWVTELRPRGPTAQAVMLARSGSAVVGRVAFREESGRVIARFEFSGLRPNSEHGFHVHANGDCSAPDASSAGGHFNPGKSKHGHHAVVKKHAGDLPNLRTDGEGIVRGEIPVSLLTVSPGAYSVVGRAVVIHRDPDNYRSQPAGKSGPRIACGVLELAG